jgi:hypothetical protein
LIFNSLTMVLIPGTQARFDQAMGDMLRDMPGAPGTPTNLQFTATHVPVWLGVMFAVPLLSLLLWLIVRRKEAFQA